MDSYRLGQVNLTERLQESGNTILSQIHRNGYFTLLWYEWMEDMVSCPGNCSLNLFNLWFSVCDILTISHTVPFHHLPCLTISHTVGLAISHTVGLTISHSVGLTISQSVGLTISHTVDNGMSVPSIYDLVYVKSWPFHTLLIMGCLYLQDVFLEHHIEPILMFDCESWTVRQQENPF